MDESNTRWFRWVARNAPHLFTLTWGLGMGAFGAVLFKVIDVAGDALRVYIGVLTVMMGGALGLVSSRAIDYMADSRKRRRRVNLARAQMRLLRWDLSKLAELILEARKAKEDDPKKILPMKNAYDLFVSANRVRASSASPPSMEDMVDTDEDVRHAENVHSMYTFFQDLFAWTATEEMKNELSC